MIPRVAHRIWLHPPGPPPPRLVEEHGEQFRRHHPGWVLIDWTSADDLPDLVNRDLFDRAAEVYPDDFHRFRADIVRVELVAALGGVYLDCDTGIVGNLEPVIGDTLCFAGRSPQHHGGHHPITQAVFGAAPHHPYITAVRDSLPDAARRYQHLPLAQSIGPWHFTRVYESGMWPDVTIFDPPVLYGPGSPIRHLWNSGRRRRGEGLY